MYSKLELARDPSLRIRGKRKITVPRGTKRIYIPRTKWYHPDVIGEDSPRLELQYDLLQPCIVERGTGWNKWHICQFHQVFIEEGVTRGSERNIKPSRMRATT